MTITVDAPQKEAVFGEVDAVDVMALRVRAAVYAKNGAADGEAAAQTTKDDVVANEASITTAKEAVATAEARRISSIKGVDSANEGAPFASEVDQQAAIDGAMTDLAAAEEALIVAKKVQVAAGQAEALATNADWYGTADGTPEVADVSGADAYSV